MIDREALAAAIKWELGETPLEPYERTKDHQSTIVAAARERLAQMAEKCPICRGNSGPASNTSCETCNERGKLYPPALVERIAKVLYRRYPLEPVSMNRDAAVAVLDALNTEPVLDRNTKGTW